MTGQFFCDRELNRITTLVSKAVNSNDTFRKIIKDPEKKTATKNFVPISENLYSCDIERGRG